MSELGVVFYRGPSLLTGDAIVGVVTGLDAGSLNAKTGRVAQAWILREDRPPMDAKRANVDDAICGDCKLRGRDGKNSGCYVVPWQAPFNVYKSFIAGDYPVVSWPELHAVVEGRVVRLGAYGDPAAIPFDLWRQLLRTAESWIGYSHAWRYCDPRFKTIVMASVDTIDEFHQAQLAGWRTFRIRGGPDEPLVTAQLPRGRAGVRQVALEFVCPASDEASHRVTCADCRLCRGTSSPARSVAILPHGKPSSLRVFGLKSAAHRVEHTANYSETIPEPSLLRAKFYRQRSEVPSA